MKKIVLTSLVIALLSSPLAFAEGPAAGGAKAVVQEATFDFGYLLGGEVVSHSYFVQSRGTDSLKILQVRPGCGCTKAPLKKDVIAIGDSAEIELVYTSTKGSRGATSKSASVTSNDNSNPLFQISFSGKAYDHPDSLKPLALSDGTIKLSTETKAKEAKLVVRNVSTSGVKLHLVSWPNGYLEIDIPDSEIKPGKQKEIKVKLDPTLTEQEFKKSFTFGVNDSAGTRYTIAVILTKAAQASNIQPPPAKKINGKG